MINVDVLGPSISSESIGGRPISDFFWPEVQAIEHFQKLGTAGDKNRGEYSPSLKRVHGTGLGTPLGWVSVEAKVRLPPPPPLPPPPSPPPSPSSLHGPCLGRGLGIAMTEGFLGSGLQALCWIGNLVGLPCRLLPQVLNALLELPELLGTENWV